MPENRCDLILLGWTAFVGFNLISDFLWSNNGNDGSGVGGVGSAANLAMSTSEHYRGDYRLKDNGTVIDEGTLRLTLASQQTSVMSVSISSISMAFLKLGKRNTFTSFDADLLFTGIEFNGDVGKLTATGTSDPSRFHLFGEHSCRLDAAIKFGTAPDDDHARKAGGGESIEGEHHSTVTGEVAAVDCGYSVAFVVGAVDVLHLAQKVVHYSIWVNVLTIIQIRCFLTQMRHTDEGPNARRVSLVCISMQALMDAYDSFLHLSLGLSTQYMFNTIAVVALFKFILFSLLEARYLLTIWRQRRHEAFNQGLDSVRRELSWLYSRFYGVLVVGLVVIYNYLDRLDTIILAFQCYWVPQIVNDAWQGSKSALTPAFYVWISVTRTLFVLYLWGCPSGIFSGDLYPPLPNAPSAANCSLAVLIQASQLAVMILQQRLGPRWFIPWFCMPWAYNYHRQSRVEPGTDCVICMTEVDPEDGRRVTTPCNHSFHRLCLEQWMDIKMECPTCRTVLPPIQ